jgi:uncharacterized protein (DUF1015 family)
MAEIRPFRGVRPADALAGDLIAPPYDVLDRAEARAILAANPRSFLAVTRADATLPDDADAHGAPVYAAARANLDRMLAQGDLVQDDGPCFYLYSQTWKGRTQTGLMAACSVDEYDRGDIKKHELTRPTKEQDRVDHVSALDAQTGLVFLAFRDRFDAVRDALAQAADRAPAWRVTTDDGVTHALTVVADAAVISSLQQAFAAVPALYIADGHHRSAAASRVAAARQAAGSSGWFLAGIFPDSELQVLAYNRRVADLNGHSPASFRAAVAERFVLTDTDQAAPPRRGTVTMYLDGRWTLLEPRPGVVPDDPVGSLDVAVLQDNVLGPLLGIDNPRTDERIDFVGGIRGADALTASVDAGQAAVAFHLYPTAMSQLFDVADADRLMPPKSTWFEPKLRGGVVLHRLV